MVFLQVAILLLVMSAGTGVVFTRTPENQVVCISFFGLMLAIMFLIFRAPDVALSQIVIGIVGLPLMVLLALACLKKQR